MATKKYSVLALLEVLKEYSDEEHWLLFKEIKYYLEEDYGIDVSEKTIRTDLRALIDFGYDIRFADSFRRVVTYSDGTVLDSDINTGCYLVGPLSDLDIEILFSALANERFLSDARYKEIGDRLEGLSSSCDFSLRKKAVLRGRRDFAYGDLSYENIYKIKEAIATRKVISFNYTPALGHHPKDFPRDTMMVSPYKIFAEDGVYYMVGCATIYYPGEQLVFLRLERMRNIRVVDYKKYSILDIIGPKMITDDYDNGRFRLCPGQNSDITIRYDESLFQEACDNFGKRNMSFSFDQKNNLLISRFSAPEAAVVRFVLTYAPNVEVLDPPELRDRVKDIFAQGLVKHE